MAEIKENDPLRVLLWTMPRSASTVFTKFMSFVNDVEIWHEPYQMSFANELAFLSDKQKVLGMMENLYDMYPVEKRGNLRPLSTFSYESVKRDLEQQPKDISAKFIFVKDMSPGINGHFEFLPQKVPVKYVFLIRHPHRYLTSNRLHFMRIFQKSSYDVREDVIMRTGEDELFKLWKHVRENFDPNPLVIDSDQYLQTPEKVLPKLFSEIGIPWKESYLSWDESDKIVTTWHGALEVILSDKVTQGQIFKRALESSKFHPVDKPIPTREELHPDVIPIVDNYMPGYKEMSKHLLYE